jgi:hypothetical protein
MRRKVIFISDNEELHTSLHRALNVFADTDSDCLGREMSFDKQIFKNRHAVVLLDAIDMREIRKWRNILRVNKCVNPFVAITCATLPREEFENDENHSYVKVPFDLQELLSKIVEVKPILSPKRLHMCIIDWLTHNSHDIQDTLLSVRDGRRKSLKLIGEIVSTFNPSEDIREQAEKVLAMLNTKKYSGYNIAEAISKLFGNLKTHIAEARSVNEALVIDDVLERSSELGRDIVALVEKDLKWKAVFVKDPEKALTAIGKNTKFVFLDIKFEGAPSETVKVLEKRIKERGIPYIILSNFDFPKEGPELFEPKNILKGLENRIWEEIRPDSLKREQRLTLQKLGQDVNEIKNVIYEYERGEKEKEEILKIIEDKEGLKNYSGKELNAIRQFIDSQALPEKFESYPHKFYRVETIVKRDFAKKRDYIKNLIEGATTPTLFTKSCTCLLDEDSMSCCLTDEKNQAIGTFSFSATNKRDKRAWQMLRKCVEKYPAPVAFRSEDKHKYADTINSKVKKGTNGRILRLVERVGKGKYRLSEVKNITRDSLSTERQKNGTYITRTEFSESLEKLERKLGGKIGRLEDLLHKVVKELKKP